MTCCVPSSPFLLLLLLLLSSVAHAQVGGMMGVMIGAGSPDPTDTGPTTLGFGMAPSAMSSLGKPPDPAKKVKFMFRRTRASLFTRSAVHADPDGAANAALHLRCLSQCVADAQPAKCKSLCNDLRDIEKKK